MHKTFRALGAAGALLCLTATVAAAQNNSDHIATLISQAPNSGGYGVGASGRGGNRGAPAVTSEIVANEARILAGGSAAERMVGAVLAGGPTTALANLLIAAGAPAAEVNALMQALTRLATNPNAGALQSAIAAYNNVVRAASAAFVNGPPAAFLAIEHALLALRAGV
jgi:hypothetical protein